MNLLSRWMRPTNLVFDDWSDSLGASIQAVQLLAQEELVQMVYRSSGFRIVTDGWAALLRRKLERSERTGCDCDRCQAGWELYMVWSRYHACFGGPTPVSYTHLRAHETPEHLVCRLLLEKKKKNKNNNTT
eukprot:TRINITY_DN61551_c0_g1_i1.p1 TRINITY_DN61551_c0_g1~~TRINITY_DN61551_c0_g1_i1.p1  ORF type:complete len:131 (+),score=34.05 TRINITY_DN61551_c0_g1_i1:205-597(+)